MGNNRASFISNSSMRQFIIRFSMVSLLLALTVGLLVTFNYWRTQSFIAQHQGGTIILGDSHAATDIHPQILNASNFAHTAEPLLATSKKLEWITKKLHPDTILLVLSPNNFAGYNDFKFSNKQWSSEMAKRYYPLFPESFWTQYTDPLTAQVNSYRQQLLPKLSGRPAFIGKFKPKPIQEKRNDIQKTLNRHFNPKYPAISESSKLAIETIKNTCERERIAFLVVIAPLLPEYKSAIPNQVQQVFNAITAKLDVISLNIELPDSNYYNADHLNLNGAKTFTKTLRAAISEQMIRQME